MDVILGIDIGGSTTKIVGLRADGSVISMLRVRAEAQVTSLYGALGNYLTSNHLTRKDVRRVVLTGVGASFVEGDIYGPPSCKVDEFSASCTGALALSGQDSAVVVTMGTGTAFLWAEQDGSVRHLCGSGIGGGTLGGLCRKLVGMERFGQIKKLAESKGCFIIKTPYDTYTATRLVNQSMPIRYFMKQKALITFQRNDYVDDIRETMAKKRYRDFPIMDLNGSYYGMISRRSLLGARKKRLVLVDHNEVTQAVDGLDEAEVLEVIDHHRIGSLETMNPVYFRNQPLGCTATIIYQMYREQELEISREIAGLLCSAILSDTLIFRSPTCTETDKKAAYALAQIAGIEPESYAAEMFAAGSNLSAKTPEEIFYQDFKKFVVNDVSFGVGQINSMTQKDLEDVRERMIPYMAKALTAHSIPMLFFMLTDILQGTTELLCAGNGADPADLCGVYEGIQWMDSIWHF